jgi:NitT/TauT family transport system permease protein
MGSPAAGRAGPRLLTVLFFAVSMALWEGAVRGLEVPPFILPAPSAVAVALWRGLASGLYVRHLGHTLAETVLGFLLGSALGLCLGTLVATSRWVEYFLYPYIVMFQSLPKIALAPLIVIWFGLGLASKVVNAALVAFFPLLVNTMVGLRSTDEDRVSLMRSLAASERQIFWMLRLPNALPFVMAGLDVAMIFALIGAIVGEFVGATAGLGMLIQSMNFTMDVSGQFSVLLVLSVVGLALNRTIQLVRRRVLFWDPSEKATRAPAEGEEAPVPPALARDPRARKKEVTAW